LFSKAAADEASAMYLAGWPADDPRVSPVLGDWAGQPRVLIQASTSEVLRDDAVALAAAARSAGVDVTLTLYPDVPHVWHLRYPHDPAAVAAFDEISGFVAP
jgi:acetyl esterase/lipase